MDGQTNKGQGYVTQKQINFAPYFWPTHECFNIVFLLYEGSNMEEGVFNFKCKVKSYITRANRKLS